jgi:hypothetical protein
VLSGFGSRTDDGILEETTDCPFVAGMVLVQFSGLSRLGDELSTRGLKYEGTEVVGVSSDGAVMRGSLNLGNTFEG